MRIQVHYMDGSASMFHNVMEDSMMVKDHYLTWEVDNNGSDLIYVPLRGVHHWVTLVDELPNVPDYIPTLLTRHETPVVDGKSLIYGGKEYWEVPF